MNLSFVLGWFVVVAAVTLVVRAFQTSLRENGGWAVVGLLLLAILGVGWWRDPSQAGYWGALAAVPLVVVPLQGMGVVRSLMARQRYGPARRLALVVRWFHPAPAWMKTPTLLEALELSSQGEVARAEAILAQAGMADTSLGYLGRLYHYHAIADWEAARQVFETSPERERLIETLGSFYLRALGETGDLDGMMAFFKAHEARIERLNPKAQGKYYLPLLAFTGQADQVRRLFDGSLVDHPTQEVVDFWCATADLAAGHEHAGREVLTRLSVTSSPLVQRAARVRLGAPPAVASVVLDATYQPQLAAITQRVDHLVRFGPSLGGGRERAKITAILVGLNLVMFGVAASLGGSTSPSVLYRLGAVAPREVLDGAWWRLLAALFLHHGATHLILNMLALLYFGPSVERLLRPIPYLLLYLGAGVGSGLLVTLLAVESSAFDLFVGASGSIMALLGARGAILWRGWRQERSRVALHGLVTLGLLLALQVFFDVVTPQVSSVAHAGGLVLGFLMAQLALQRTERSNLDARELLA